MLGKLPSRKEGSSGRAAAPQDVVSEGICMRRLAINRRCEVEHNLLSK